MSDMWKRETMKKKNEKKITHDPSLQLFIKLIYRYIFTQLSLVQGQLRENDERGRLSCTNLRSVSSN